MVAATVFVAVAARAQASASPPLIWYRSGEGCLDGSGFLERLAARGVTARLAVVGDPIDFVVTLGTGADGAHGLLERQTKTGTVAIRRLDGGTCDEIADGLALSLSLADAPEERRRDEPAATASKPATDGPARAEPLPERNSAPTRSLPPARDVGAHVAIGIQGNVVSGVAPVLLPGASVFIGFEPRAGVLPRSSLRAAVFGDVGAASADGYHYNIWLLGGRIQACPVWIGGASLRAHPCASVDLGAIQTTGTGVTGRAAGDFWAAARFGVRLDLAIAERLALEAEIDAELPLTRYDIVAGQAETSLYRTAPAGVAGGLGVYFILP